MSVCRADDSPWCSPGTCVECDAARATETQPKRRGRRPAAPGAKRDIHASVCLRRDDHARLAAAAKSAGISISDYLRAAAELAMAGDPQRVVEQHAATLGATVA